MKRLLFLVAVLVIASMQANLAYGHFFGSTKTVDNYQIVFSPYP